MQSPVTEIRLCQLIITEAAIEKEVYVENRAKLWVFFSAWDFFLEIFFPNLNL